jgi:hypothetical protein
MGIDKKAKRIMEPYFKQIETGELPTFPDLMWSYTDILNAMPLPEIEMACITSLLVTLYPVEFGEAMKVEWKRRGFTVGFF